MIFFEIAAMSTSISLDALVVSGANASQLNCHAKAHLSSREFGLVRVSPRTVMKHETSLSPVARAILLETACLAAIVTNGPFFFGGGRIFRQIA